MKSVKKITVAIASIAILTVGNRLLAQPTSRHNQVEIPINACLNSRPSTVELFDSNGVLQPCPTCSYRDSHTYDEFDICFGVVDPSSGAIYSVIDGSLLGFVI